VTQPPDHHLKALWQGQETETPTMTAQAVRALARNYSSNLRDSLMLVAGIAIIMTIPILWTAWKAPNNGIRVGELLVLAGVAWIFWRVRGRWPRRMPEPDASVDALIDFHLAQLTRQRVSYGDTLVNIGPMLAAIATLFYGIHSARPQAGLEKYWPFFGMVAVWAVMAWALQRRGIRRLQEQIDEIKAMKQG
jgi:hypothetical protein